MIGNLDRIFNSLSKDEEFWLQKKNKNIINEIGEKTDSWDDELRLRGSIQTNVKSVEGIEGKREVFEVLGFFNFFDLKNFYDYRIKRVLKNGSIELYSIKEYINRPIISKKEKFVRVSLSRILNDKN